MGKGMSKHLQPEDSGVLACQVHALVKTHGIRVRIKDCREWVEKILVVSPWVSHTGIDPQKWRVVGTQMASYNTEKPGFLSDTDFVIYSVVAAALDPQPPLGAVPGETQTGPSLLGEPEWPPPPDEGLDNLREPAPKYPWEELAAASRPPAPVKSENKIVKQMNIHTEKQGICGLGADGWRHALMTGKEGSGATVPSQTPRRTWLQQAIHKALEDGEEVEEEDLDYLTSSAAAYPVFVQRENGQQVRVRRPIPYKFIKDLREAVHNYGPGSAYVKRLISSNIQTAAWLPTDWDETLQAVLESSHYTAWAAYWWREARLQAEIIDPNNSLYYPAP
ncbi:uncharacterized protein LOC141498844 [Macrotis lagotis]|uniref:uncharacterized protein LOC141498844 n=1 Tax=Macrotis lagotis TaxID=92651 RepID=UPI003D69E8E4